MRREGLVCLVGVLVVMMLMKGVVVDVKGISVGGRERVLLRERGERGWILLQLTRFGFDMYDQENVEAGETIIRIVNRSGQDEKVKYELVGPDGQIVREAEAERGEVTYIDVELREGDYLLKGGVEKEFVCYIKVRGQI